MNFSKWRGNILNQVEKFWSFLLSNTQDRPVFSSAVSTCLVPPLLLFLSVVVFHLSSLFVLYRKWPIICLSLFLVFNIVWFFQLIGPVEFYLFLLIPLHILNEDLIYYLKIKTPQQFEWFQNHSFDWLCQLLICLIRQWPSHRVITRY